MKFLGKRPYVCVETRVGFIRQVFRWFFVHLLSLALPFALYLYAFENHDLALQFYSLIFLVVAQGLVVVFVDRFVNIEGRVLALYPDAPNFCHKHLSAFMLVPFFSFFLVIFLCLQKKARFKRVPWFLQDPKLASKFCLGIFIFTVVGPILSLIYPTLPLDKGNFWLSTPGAYTITQTAEKLREIGRKAQDPEFLQVSDLSHSRSIHYVSALTFELVKNKLMNDIPKIRTRSLASDHFEKELGYVGNLCELMKWSDNTRIMFGYFHKAYLLPTSGSETSIAFVAEQYFLYRFKLSVHNEVVHYFEELEQGLVSKTQRDRLQSMKSEYFQLKSVKNLASLQNSWLKKLL